MNNETVDLTPEELREAAATLQKLAMMSGILSQLSPHGYGETYFQTTAFQLKKLAADLVPIQPITGYRWR